MKKLQTKNVDFNNLASQKNIVQQPLSMTSTKTSYLQKELQNKSAFIDSLQKFMKHFQRIFNKHDTGTYKNYSKFLHGIKYKKFQVYVPVYYNSL